MKFIHEKVGECEAENQQEADKIFDERMRLLNRSHSHEKE